MACRVVEFKECARQPIIPAITVPCNVKVTPCAPNYQPIGREVWMIVRLDTALAPAVELTNDLFS
jgi:hypothetical protein